MRGHRPLWAAATLAGLLAAGCDYWDNLVHEKSVTRAPLSLTLTDAWTRDTLPNAQCSEAGEDELLMADKSGVILIREMATGRHTFHCVAESYYPIDKSFDVRSEGGSFPVELARKGGADWYPEDTSLQMEFADAFDSLRYPPNKVLATLPGKYGSIFRYKWSFTKNKRLDGPLMPAHGRELRLKAPIQDITDPGRDEVTITVYSGLRGPDSLYEIASKIIPFTWTRNALPTLNDTDFQLAKNRFPRMGCKVDEKLNFQIMGSDPDGDCVRIVYTSADLNSAIGAFRGQTSCTDRVGIQVPLLSPYSRGSLNKDGPLTVANRLFVDIYDDNGESKRDTLDFLSRTNVLPRASLSRLGSEKAYYSGSQVHFVAKIQDSDDPVNFGKIDWGDGIADEIKFKIEGVDSVQDTVSHDYDKPGEYSPILYVVDNCGDTMSYKLGQEVIIRYNSPPEISLTASRFNDADPGTYLVKFSVHDTDADIGIDSLDVLLNWGDGTPTETLLNLTKSLFREDRTHKYLAAPPDSADHYVLTIRAQDHWGGKDTLTRSIEKFKP